MDELRSLPRNYPRKFVPDNADLADWGDISGLYDRLDRCDIATPEGLAEWLADWDELSDAVGEEGTIRNIASDLHTDNPELEKAHLHFVENIRPKLKPREQSLKKLFLSAGGRKGLGPEYRLLDRAIAEEFALYRDENIPLATEDEKLALEYQKLCGSLTVEFEGKERTLDQLRPVLEETDRARREKAWRLAADRRLREREKYDSIFESMLDLRGRMAANAGCADFREYAFRAYQRFDYTPAHCEAFHSAVEKCVVPLVKRLQEERRRKLGVEALRPWDLEVDQDGKPPLRPFQGAEELKSGVSRIFHRLDGPLAGQFDMMAESGLLNLENYKGKAPGGYQATLSERRLPFIFMNSVGTDRDLQTLVHESGHCFHALAARDQRIASYRHAPTEFCEVASMGMELLAMPNLDEFYRDPEVLARARRVRLETIIDLLPWIATVDAFQHWLYTHRGHSRSERREAWLGLMERFGGAVDWAGLEEARACRWHRQLHFYVAPFYYIEYGIAQLGALGLWLAQRRNPAGAIASYKRALALGGSRPLPELFKAADLPFDFSERAVGPLVEEASRDLLP